MANKSEWPPDENAFLEWFWEDENGDNLIKKLNNVTGRNGYIRREKYPPYIYGVVVNQGTFPFKEKGVQWKLCKVGFTHCDTTEGENNRMEQVVKEVKKNYRDASTIFVLRIGTGDTSKHRDAEKGIREKVGKRLRKDKAKELNLPYPTEWVLTTQGHIDHIKEKKKEQVKAVKVEKAEDVIDFFEEIQAPPSPPAKLKEDGWFE